MSSSPPSRWVTRFAGHIAAAGSVADLACGGGRHTRWLAREGYRVLAVDRDLSGVADLANHPRVECLRADLEDQDVDWPLGQTRFDGVVVTNYLWRPRLRSVLDAVAPDGVLLYETFAAGNARFGKPSNSDFLLRPGELREAVANEFHVIAFEEGEVTLPRPAMIQRICARRK